MFVLSVTVNNKLGECALSEVVTLFRESPEIFNSKRMKFVASKQHGGSFEKVLPF